MSRKTRTPTRERRGVEAHLDLERIHALHDGAPQAIAQATQTARNIMAIDLAGAAIHAAAAGKPNNLFAWDNVDELQRDLEGTLARFVAAGRRQVADELDRQRAAGAGKTMAEKRLARKGHGLTPAGTQLVKATAALMAAQMAADMRETAAKAVLAKSAQSLTPAALEETILAASDTTALRLAGSVTNLVNLGRSEEAGANRDEIRDAVYSALTDANCCPECEAMDGEQTDDLDEAAGWTPNVSCDGGDRCRCVVMYELRQ